MLLEAVKPDGMGSMLGEDDCIPHSPMSDKHRATLSVDFQGGLPEAFLAGYHAAVSLVKAEISRPVFEKLTLNELEVMLRRQSTTQLSRWQQG